jgi:hypothetical protein
VTEFILPASSGAMQWSTGTTSGGMKFNIRRRFCLSVYKLLNIRCCWAFFGESWLTKC